MHCALYALLPPISLVLSYTVVRQVLFGNGYLSCSFCTFGEFLSSLTLSGYYSVLYCYMCCMLPNLGLLQLYAGIPMCSKVMSYLYKNTSYHYKQVCPSVAIAYGRTQ